MNYILSVLLLFIYVTGAFAQLKAPVNDNDTRKLRYKPRGGGFEIINGDRKFTRALYGTNTAFRIETSDVPEFGLFMPKMGGNLQLGLILGEKSIWLNNADYIKSTYFPGTRVYEIRDSLIGNGVIKIKVLAMGDADGMILQIETAKVPKNAELFFMYGGASNKGFSRNGDLGVDKPDCFDLHTEACVGNVFSIEKNAFVLDYGQSTKEPRSIDGIFPKGAKLKTSSPFHLNSPLETWSSEMQDDKPVLVTRISLKNEKPSYVALRLKGENRLKENDLLQIFNLAEQRRLEIANTVQIETPDKYINPVGGVLGTAADAIWDSCWMHGSIGWRMPLNGWRAGYTGDCVGWHDRARLHFDRYAASQVTDVEPVIPHPAQDTIKNFARAAKIWGTPMYSNGYICRNPEQNTKMHHYDMNLCYIDELLWHLNWTGDLAYAKKIWPVIERHLNWEKLNFDPDNDGLYDAYASIWASDALYYNSGAVTHSSAYNYRANKMAAMIASKIGENPKPYEEEANKILTAINDKLWLKDDGHWAEFIDFMGYKNTHPNAAVWTVYHAIDSDIADMFQAYQATRYVDTEIPHIPVKAKGLEEEDYQIVSTTHWFPYSWSINNVAFAEVAHTALAYWQAGRYNEAFNLFKSEVLDGMYLGSSPGNIGQISYYDKARGECYRDFGDPVGMYSRVLIQGLFGIKPDLLNDKLVMQPGFPSDWDSAAIHTADISFQFHRSDSSDVFHILNRLKKQITIDLRTKPEKSGIKEVLVNGKKHAWSLIENVGFPMIQVSYRNLDSAKVEIIWDDTLIQKSEYKLIAANGSQWKFSSAYTICNVYDPQQILKNQEIGSKSLTGKLKGKCGHHSLFIMLKRNDLEWWEPVDVEIIDPFTIKYNLSNEGIRFYIKNNKDVAFKGKVIVNKGKGSFVKMLDLPAGDSTSVIKIPMENRVFGTNTMCIQNERDSTLFNFDILNWDYTEVPGEYEMVNLDGFFNASVTDIFKQEYLTPRSPYTTLQIPLHGIGEWCHPLMSANIDDSGLRECVKNDVLNTSFHIPFRTTGDSVKQKILFTALWDNFPDKKVIPLQGKARHAYLLMAGSTNHMQCHIPNGKVVVCYSDGSRDSLLLVNPDNWLPIEQDLYTDHYAFKLNRPAPYRVAFKSGIISRDLGTDLGIDSSEVYGRVIDGGAGIVVDLPLDDSKELESISVESLANDVVIGLMSLTLMK